MQLALLNVDTIARERAPEPIGGPSWLLPLLEPASRLHCPERSRCSFSFTTVLGTPRQPPPTHPTPLLCLCATQLWTGIWIVVLLIGTNIGAIIQARTLA